MFKLEYKQLTMGVKPFKKHTKNIHQMLQTLASHLTDDLKTQKSA